MSSSDDSYDDNSFDDLSQSKVEVEYEIKVGTTIDIGSPGTIGTIEKKIESGGGFTPLQVEQKRAQVNISEEEKAGGTELDEGKGGALSNEDNPEVGYQTIKKTPHRAFESRPTTEALCSSPAVVERKEDTETFETFTAFHAKIEAKMKERSERRRKEQQEWERHFHLSRKLKQRERRRRIREQRIEFSKAMESIARRKREKEERRTKERRMEELRRQRLHQRRLLAEIRRKAREDAMLSTAAQQLQLKASTSLKGKGKQIEKVAVTHGSGPESHDVIAGESAVAKKLSTQPKGVGQAVVGEVEGAGERQVMMDQRLDRELVQPRPSTKMRAVKERKLMEVRRRRNIAEQKRKIVDRKRREAERDELRRERMRIAKEEEQRMLDMEKRKLIALQRQRHRNFSKLRNEDSPVYKLEQRRKRQIQFEQAMRSERKKMHALEKRLDREALDAAYALSNGNVESNDPLYGKLRQPKPKNISEGVRVRTENSRRQKHVARSVKKVAYVKGGRFKDRKRRRWGRGKGDGARSSREPAHPEVAGYTRLVHADQYRGRRRRRRRHNGEDSDDTRTSNHLALVGTLARKRREIDTENTGNGIEDIEEKDIRALIESRAVNLSDVLEMRYLFAEIAGERASIDASDLRTLLEVFCTASEEADIEAGITAILKDESALDFSGFVRTILSAREGEITFAGSKALLLAIHQKLLTTQREAEMMVGASGAASVGAGMDSSGGRLHARHRVDRKGLGRRRGKAGKKGDRRRIGNRKSSSKARKTGQTRREKRIRQSQSVPGLRHGVTMYNTITATVEDVATVSEEEGLNETQ